MFVGPNIPAVYVFGLILQDLKINSYIPVCAKELTGNSTGRLGKVEQYRFTSHVHKRNFKFFYLI